jgi:PAS domain S-box-containing protein
MASPLIAQTDFPSTGALPDFDSTGHLPVGIHPGTLASLARKLRFNEHRRKMWRQFASFLVDPVVKHKFSAVYVGGGFVSSKPEPSDIDVVLETASPYGAEALEAVAPFFVIGLHKIEMIYGVHLQFWMRGAPSGLTDYRTFFQYDRSDSYTPVLNRTRGIVRVDLTESGTLLRLRRYIRGENTAPVPALVADARRLASDGIDQLQGIKRQVGLVAANASKVVIVSDATGRIEWVNECFTQTCGYTLDEVQGKKPGAFLQGPGSDREAIQLLHQAVSEAQECECRLINYRKDGTPYAVKIVMSPIFESGQLTGFLAVEEELGESQARLQPGPARQAA